MKKSQLQEKVQKHVDELFLSENEAKNSDATEDISCKKEGIQAFFRFVGLYFKKDALAEKEKNQAALQENERLAEVAAVEKADVQEDAPSEQEEYQATPQEKEKVVEVVEVEKAGVSEEVPAEQGKNQAVLSVTTEEGKEKTYSPKLVRKANEFIYDFLVCRVSDKNLKNFCRKWDNVSGKRYWFVSPNLSFQNDLGLDDLDLTEFIMVFEEKYGKTFSDEDYENIKTVADFYDIFERYWFKK